MSSIKHLQSATQIIELDGIKVLTDPWLVKGEYLGSWFHYPPFNELDIKKLEYDFIYVSHIHPDHLSEKTFELLPKKAPVLICKFDSIFLKKKIESFGFECLEINHAEPFFLSDKFKLTIFRADNCDPEKCGKFFGCDAQVDNSQASSVDTLALFENETIKILNTNDCPYDLASEVISENLNFFNNIDYLLVGYAGAGPYPQCFNFSNENEKKAAAKKKEIMFLDLAIKFCELIKPNYFIPFAGTYVLGGSLVKLNDYRGVPDIQKAVDYIEKKTLLNGISLMQGDEIKLESGEKIEMNSCEKISKAEFFEEIGKFKFNYQEGEFNLTEKDTILKINLAYERFLKTSKQIGFSSNTKIYIKTEEIGFVFSLNSKPKILSLPNIEYPYLQISLDHELFKRLISGPRYAHWNNAEIGSHLTFSRNPDIYERGLFFCLYYFHA